MQSHKCSLLVFACALFFSLPTINAQTISAKTKQSSVAGAEVDWVQDWGTVSVAYAASARQVFVKLPKDRQGRQLKISLTNQVIQSVTFIDENGRSTLMHTNDRKTYTLNPKDQRKGGDRGEFIEIYNPTGSATAKQEMKIKFNNF